MGQAFEILFQVCGGLGIFLLGMKNMSEGMQAVAGDKIRKLISAVTNNRILACSVGTVVTSIVQSSSVTTVMVVGMANAGLMTLMQAIGVILGANIGTTITGWILVLKIGKYGLPMLGVAAFFFLFSKKDRIRFTAMVFVGLGMVFFGLQLMKLGFAPIKEMPAFEEWFHRFDPSTGYLGLVKCLAVGAILTAVVQSSSATLGITMGLAATGAISYPAAAALAVGANVGTTITAFLASLGTSTTAKRAAYAHTIFNVIGVFWIALIFPWYSGTVSKMVTNMRVDDIKAVLLATSDQDEVDAYLFENHQLTFAEYAQKYRVPEDALYMTDENGQHLNAKGKALNEAKPYAMAMDLIKAIDKGKLTDIPLYANKNGKKEVQYPYTQAGIAFTHTVFNVVNTLLFLPFTGLLARLLMWMVPEKKVPEKPRLTYLNVRMLDTPAIGVEQSHKEVIKMGRSVIEMLENLKKVFKKGEPDPALCDTIFRSENDLDIIQMEVVEFLGDIMAGNISHDVVHEGRSQLRIADEFESISDYVTNILKLRLKLDDTQQRMTEEGVMDIQHLHDMVAQYIGAVFEAVERGDQTPEFFADAKAKGNAITRTMKDCRTKHLERVGQGIATPLKSLIYTDMLTAYRRIKDHAFNIAEVLIGEK